MRTSKLEEDEFIDHFFDDGSQRSHDSWASDYGTNADVTAIGPFSPEIAQYLEQDEEYYKNTEVGKNVISGFILYSRGKNETIKLANCLGIDILDFNQHELDCEKINIFLLKKEFPKQDTKAFIKLREYGFTFFFTPDLHNPSLLKEQWKFFWEFKLHLRVTRLSAADG